MSFQADEIEDLKQLVAANNGALLAELEKKQDEKLEEKLEAKLQPLEQRLYQKFDDLADFVREAIDTSNDATDE